MILRKKQKNCDLTEQERVRRAKLLPLASEEYRQNGLSALEAAERTQNGLQNEAVVSASKTVREIFCENIFTYYNLIFTTFALMLIAVGSFRDLAFMGVVLCNTAIGIIQELRAKKMLDALRFMHAPKATVIRDGKEVFNETVTKGTKTITLPGQTGTGTVNYTIVINHSDGWETAVVFTN